MIMQRIIVGTKHTPILAENGFDAWEILQSSTDISLVITDCQMENIDGRQLNRMLRASSKLSHMPLIMISAYVSFSEVAALLKEGVSRFLPKPLDPAQLASYIRLLLGERRTSTHY